MPITNYDITYGPAAPSPRDRVIQLAKASGTRTLTKRERGELRGIGAQHTELRDAAAELLGVNPNALALDETTITVGNTDNLKIVGKEK